jgi:hypothetical protein
MDLRSLWRRRGGQPGADSNAADAAESAGAQAGAPGAAAGAVAVERPSRPAWRDLAAIPPTVHPHPLVAPTVSFSHGLSGHQPAPLALEALGHDRPADAPAGVVTGLFVGHSPHTPIQDDSGGTTRAVVRGHAARPTDSTDPATPGPPRLAGTSSSSGAAGSSARSSSAPIASAAAPTPRPVVARSVAGGGTGARMTTAPAPPSAAPPGMIGRPAVAGSPAAVERPGAAEAASPSGISATPSISITATPVEPDPDRPPAARRNLGQTRRLRIGPAIGPGALDEGAAGHDGHPIGRSGASGRSPSPPDDLRDLAVAGGRPSLEPGAAPAGPAGPAPSRPTVARYAAGPAASGEPGGPDAVAAPTDVQRAAVPGSLGRPVPARPIAATRPIERAPLVGRLEVTRGSRSRTPGDGRAARGHGAPADAGPRPRSTVQDALAAMSGGSPMPTAGSGGGAGGGTSGTSGASTGGGQAAIQRSAAEGSRSAWDGGSGWPADAGALTGFGGSTVAGAPPPTVARSVGGGALASGPSTPAGSATGSWSAPIRQLRATAAGARHADTTQQRARGVPDQVAVGTLVSRAAATTPSPAPTPSPARTIWRTGTSDDDGTDGPAAGEAAGAGIVDTIQRLEAGETVVASRSAAATASTPTVLRAEAGEGGGGAAATGQSEKELDELARKLFPRLQLRLRGELLIDRERIGALVDLGR